MHPILNDYAREYLKENLLSCSFEQRLMFKRMYAKGNLDLPIKDVVDNMDENKLDCAIDQVMRTIVKNLSDSLKEKQIKNQKEMEKIKMQIKINGLEISGSTEEIYNAAKQYGWELPLDFKGDDEFYLSGSKGKLMKISEMNQFHIKNAFLKLYRKWVEDLSNVKDLEELLELIKNGPTEKIYIGLLSELMMRVNEMKNEVKEGKK
jgi:hypothetical protein